MKIIDVSNGSRPDTVVIVGLVGGAEFRQLAGNLTSICLCATKTIVEKSSIIKTGARHSHAKYFLFPATLRRRFKTEEFNFEKIVCGSVRYRDKLYIIYEVPRKI